MVKVKDFVEALENAILVPLPSVYITDYELEEVITFVHLGTKISITLIPWHWAQQAHQKGSINTVQDDKVHLGKQQADRTHQGLCLCYVHAPLWQWNMDTAL